MQENEICKLACVSIKKVPNSFLVIHWAPWQLACFKRTTKFDVFALPRQELRRRAQWSIFIWRHCRHVGGPKQLIFSTSSSGPPREKLCREHLTRRALRTRLHFLSPGKQHGHRENPILFCQISGGKINSETYKKGKSFFCFALHYIIFFIQSSVVLLCRVYTRHIYLR